MVCCVQAEEVLDPRCYATVGIEPRTRALLTAVPHRGALLREGRSSRRERPFWAVTLRAVDGPAAGVHAELRLWPESNLEWFQGRLALLCESDPGDDRRALARRAARAAPAQPRGALVRRDPRDRRRRARRRRPGSRAPRPRAELAGRSARGTGRPARGAAARRAGGAAPPPALQPRRGRRGARRAVRRLAPAAAFAVDIETDCGPLGAPADWSPADGAVRLLQVAARIGGEIVCGVVDCYRVAPRPLLRLLADGREIIAHNARYEQAWLTFHFGLPAWRAVMDTSCAFRVFERHWSIQDPAYERRDATLATVTRRLLGAPKGDYGPDWWGAEPLPAAQLDYAAYDAVALVELRERAYALADAFGCTDQVLAASRTACVEAFRRLRQPHSHVPRGGLRADRLAPTTTRRSRTPPRSSAACRSRPGSAPLCASATRCAARARSPPRCSLSARAAHERAREHGARGEAVLLGRALGGVVRDAGRVAHEQHRGRQVAREHARVVARVGGEVDRLAAFGARRLVQRAAQPASKTQPGSAVSSCHSVSMPSARAAAWTPSRTRASAAASARARRGSGAPRPAPGWSTRQRADAADGGHRARLGEASSCAASTARAAGTSASRRPPSRPSRRGRTRRAACSASAPGGERRRDAERSGHVDEPAALLDVHLDPGADARQEAGAARVVSAVTPRGAARSRSTQPSGSVRASTSSTSSSPASAREPKIAAPKRGPSSSTIAPTASGRGAPRRGAPPRPPRSRDDAERAVEGAAVGDRVEMRADGVERAVARARLDRPEVGGRILHELEPERRCASRGTTSRAASSPGPQAMRFQPPGSCPIAASSANRRR